MEYKTKSNKITWSVPPYMCSVILAESLLIVISFAPEINWFLDELWRVEGYLKVIWNVCVAGEK